MSRTLVHIVCLFALIQGFRAQIVYNDPTQNLPIEKELYYLEDRNNNLKLADITNSKEFSPIRNSVQNFGITNSSIWFRITVKNRTDIENLIFQVNQPIIDYLEFYAPNHEKGKYQVTLLGEYKPFDQRQYKTPEYLFDVKIPQDSIRTFYLKVRCKENMQVPLAIGTRISVINKSINSNLASGIYFGIMIVMMLYNLFIYSTLRDRSYILYALYIIFILLTQTSLQGYTFQLLWPNLPWLAEFSPFLFPALVGVIGLEFFKEFLKVKERLNLAFKLALIFLIPYAISIMLAFTGNFQMSFRIMEITASGVSLFMLVVAFIIYRRGYSEARFFLLGWTVFLAGVCIYVMKDFEVLPYNNFTRYTMHFGSAVEVILLSFALADRINILKKEKEESQAEALAISEQNQKLITEQNIVLEQKVHERTNELEMSNEELSATLSQLKDAQTQLVDAEKMASLGQLTAGIAHEINNPINFVLANIKPLRMDVGELLELIGKYSALKPEAMDPGIFTDIERFKKKIDLDYLRLEIEKILGGIDEGARRTAEIVSGLKNFSRLDEYDVKAANINDGIESTLILLRSSIPREVEVIRQLEDIPMIECYPGKLNQVFMNILSNALYALNKKTGGPKTLRIRTYQKGELVYVEVEDSGIGMSKEVREKIFEPFFTTKEVGEGTGLGMSIVFKIIESHHARIEVESEPGKGTRITLILNKKMNFS
ncbi:MAG TPA: 7TM diverse intracellular signaling domain-containing protein [Bacteroidia bacterium]|nr:7TM diverse intracellular signaling domain-containing protein [Bacteroidia bacterium]